MSRTELQLDNFLPAIIRSLDEGMATNMSRRITGPFRLTMTEWRILLFLAEHEALTASDIVQYTAMEKSKVSRAIANLEGLGMIEREVAEDDQRVKLLRLTEKGIKRYHALVPRVLDWERELIDALDVSEYRDLLFILDKLGRRLRDMHQRSEVAVGRAGMEEHTEGAA